MTNTTDTSPEAVERFFDPVECALDPQGSSAALRALSAALEAERKENAELKQECAAAWDKCEERRIAQEAAEAELMGAQGQIADAQSYLAERDALKAELAEAIEKAYREGWSDGSADEIHEYGSNPQDDWLISGTRRAFLARHQKEKDT